MMLFGAASYQTREFKVVRLICDLEISGRQYRGVINMCRVFLSID